MDGRPVVSACFSDTLGLDRNHRGGSHRRKHFETEARAHFWVTFLFEALWP